MIHMSPHKFSVMAAVISTKPIFSLPHHFHTAKWAPLSLSCSTTTTATASLPQRCTLTPCGHSLSSIATSVNCRYINYNRFTLFPSRSFVISNQKPGNLFGSESDPSLGTDMRFENSKMIASDGVVLDHNDNRNGLSKSYSASPSMQNQSQRKHQEEQEENNKLLTLPTVLTIARVAAVPLLISTFYMDSWWGRAATTGIFVAAAITDWLDGYLARKMKLGSAFGAFLDPVADKLMVAATLVLLCTKPLEVAMLGHVPWLLTIPAVAIIGREITMSAVREWAASQNAKLLEAVAVNNLGKWKTATQMTALTILLATRDSSVGGPGILVASGVVLLYISAGLSLWSLAVYMSKIWRILLK